MKNLIREVPLDNGLTLRFFDATRRYFGDYHQVRIEISCEVPLTPDFFDNPADCQDAIRALGGTVRFLKEVEQQGVATEAVPEVTENVIRHFLAHSRGYFESENFPKKLVQSQLNRLQTRRKAFVSPRANG